MTQSRQLMPIRSWRGGVTAAALTLAAGAASAQTPTPDTSRDSAAHTDTAAVRLTPVEVIGSILPVAGPSVRAGISARVTVVGDAELDVRLPRLLSSALSHQPGMSLYDDLGSPLKTTLVSRGFTSSPVVGLPQGISVFIDGIPVNEPDAGQVNFDLLPLDHIRQAEILSGTSALLGQYSLGGALNLRTRRGSSSPGGAIEIGGGSHESFSAAGSYGGRTATGWDYYTGAAYDREDGWRDLTSSRRLNGFANIGRTRDNAGFNLQLFAVDGSAETAGSLPQSVYDVRPDSNLSAGDFEDIQQLHLALSAFRPLARGQGSAVVFFRKTRAERFNVNQEDDPDVRNLSDSYSLGAQADWRGARSLGTTLLNGRLGLGGSVNRADVQIFQERLAPGLTTDIGSPIGKFDFYALGDLVTGRVTWSLGARYDLVRVPFRNRIDATRDTTSTFHRLSPRGGVSVALGRATTLYASAGQSFRAPALIELACADPEEPCPLPFALGDDPPLHPVVATTYEAGVHLLRDKRELSLSAYRTDVRDDIFLFPYDDASAPSGSTIDGFFANIAKTRRMGVEVSGRASAGRMALFGTYALTRATFEVDDIEIFSIRQEVADPGEEINEVEGGDRLPLVPEHTASFGASVDLVRGIALGVEARYTGERWLRGDEANEESPLADSWLTDVRAVVRIARWELLAIVRNVFDAGHPTFGTFNINQTTDTLERFLTPGEPRTVHVVLRRQFGGRRTD